MIEWPLRNDYSNWGRTIKRGNKVHTKIFPRISRHGSKEAFGVGTPVTRSPRHRPGRAVFPHPVPRLYSLSREHKVSRKHPFELRTARLGDAGFGDTELFNDATESRPGETLTLAPTPIQPIERSGDGRLVEAPQVRRVAP